jgi:hypothetical protein
VNYGAGYNFYMRKKTRVARAVECVLTPEEYARRKHDTPYLYTLGEGDNALTFVGARHSTDTNDEQFPLITEQFERAQPDVVLVEGVHGLSGQAGTERLINGLSHHEAIERGGEPVYAIKHALERNVPWLCPEPADGQLFKYLTRQLYTNDELVAWYTLRLLGQYHRRKEEVPFRAYLAPFLGYLKETTGWPAAVVNAEAALQKAAQVLGHEVNLYNPDRAAEYTDPIPWPQRWEQQTRFNEISRDAVAFRDRTIVRNVARELLAGRRVLVVYGAGHAVMQEPAYRYLFNTP